MADVITYGSYKEIYTPNMVKDLFSRVRGHSSLAKLADAEPLGFTGNQYMEFTMDDEVNIVGESEAKTRGSIGLKTKYMYPLKVEYGIRVSDEFLYASDEKKLDIIKAFNDGYAVKLARALDIMAMHGINPRTGEASEFIGTNHFDAGDQTVATTAEAEDQDISNAIATFDQYDYVDVTGMAISKAYRTSLSKLKYGDAANGAYMFPELGWGNEASSLRGLQIDINSTVSYNSSTDLAIVGDFKKYFKYGITKDIAMEVIPYGDPDNSGLDLKGHNQVFIRCETYLGWAIMDQTAFCRIVSAE